MNICIRKASSFDLIEIQSIAKEVIKTNYIHFLGDNVVDEFINSGMADSYIAEKIQDTKLILINDEIIGLCAYEKNIIDLLMIVNKFQRQGMGTTLINNVLTELFETYNEVCLESFEGNDKANAFYDKNGWVRVNVALDEAFGINKIYYRKLKN